MAVHAGLTPGLCSSVLAPGEPGSLSSPAWGRWRGSPHRETRPVPAAGVRMHTHPHSCLLTFISPHITLLLGDLGCVLFCHFVDSLSFNFHSSP